MVDYGNLYLPIGGLEDLVAMGNAFPRLTSIGTNGQNGVALTFRNPIDE